MSSARRESPLPLPPAPSAPAATLTAEAAAARAWDVVVIGAGPAGALAAALLAESGLATLLLDRARFPRGKVCGCCLNPAALHALERAGLDDLPRRLGAVPLQSLDLGVRGHRARLALPGGVSLSREALDAALVEAACARGAHFLPETVASGAGAPAPGAPRRVRIEPAARAPAAGAPPTQQPAAAAGERHRELSARLVLVADGLGGRFLQADELGSAAVSSGSRLGAGTTLERAPDAVRPGTVAMACGETGYVGLVRLQDDRLDVAAAFDARALAEAGGARGAGALAATLLARAGFTELADLPLAAAEWRGTPQLTRRPARRGAPGALLLGDACGYVEPFTGEGIAWALGSALAVQPFATAAVRAPEQCQLAGWERRWQATIGARQRTCRAVAWLLRHPRLLSPCVSALALRPSLAAPLLAGLAAPPRDEPATSSGGAASAARAATVRA